jgi:hypothetical protein
MKNIIALGLTLVMGFAALASAGPVQRTVPKDSDGKAIGHPLYGGYSFYYLDSTTERQICSGRCLLAGLYRGSGAATSFLDVRNTAVLGNTASGTLVWRGLFATTDSGMHANPITLPVLLNTGLTAKISSVSGNERVTVVYIDLDP